MNLQVNKQIEKTQYITQESDVMSHSDQALAMFDQGLMWVQLRMKNASEAMVTSEAERILRYAEKYNATLILNDDVMLAKKLNVPAVHIGLNDMPADQVRSLLGDEVIIGGTANTFEQILQQVKRGVDYVGVGPFRFTTTKQNLSPVLGLEAYRTLLSQMAEANIKVPLFAVGGITMVDVEPLAQAGVQHYAISGDLLKCALSGKAIDQRLL